YRNVTGVQTCALPIYYRRKFWFYWWRDSHFIVLFITLSTCHFRNESISKRPLRGIYMFWVYEFNSYSHLPKYRYDNWNYANYGNPIIVYKLWWKYDFVDNYRLCTCVQNCYRRLTSTRIFV